MSKMFLPFSGAVTASVGVVQDGHVLPHGGADGGGESLPVGTGEADGRALVDAETKPTTSASAAPEKAPVRSRTAAKSAVPGHRSSVCMQRMIPTFIVFSSSSFVKRRAAAVCSHCTIPRAPAQGAVWDAGLCGWTLTGEAAGIYTVFY